MKPFETILPARPVTVQRASLYKIGSRIALNLLLLAGGQIKSDVLVGTCPSDLVGLLCTELGFTLDDAKSIVRNADSPPTN